jgi:diguanylate cyclase (GGDEF)-like protein
MTAPDKLIDSKLQGRRNQDLAPRMEQINPDNWAFMHLGLIFLVTCSQMLVVYVLGDANNPTPGLGLYTVYFMAALLGWIAFTLQQGVNIPMIIDIPSVTSIFNTFILFLAAGQRAALKRGRVAMGGLCLVACFSVFFASQDTMFIIQAGMSAFFFALVASLCAWRAWQKQNVGDALTAAAGLIMLVGAPISIYQLLTQNDPIAARTIYFGVHSSAYILVALGFLASVLIEYQQHLSHLATEDPLTRLLNRRGMESALQVPMAQAARQELSTSAVMIDIDCFKEVNDNFGHDVGDQVIREIAQHLVRSSRSSDVVARTGGEEYLMILPATSLDDARSLAERIRAGIGERPLLVSRQRIPITVSAGVASVVGAVDLDALASEADRAMYLAKRAGRNRVASVENRPIHLSTTAAPP